MEQLLQEWILPKTLKSGCFGEEAELENFVIDKDIDNTGDQFASELMFVKLYIILPNGSKKTFHVVIKVQLQNEEFRKLVNSSMQFQNEILMYERILPLLDRNNIAGEIFCKYYYGYVNPNNPTKDFIVLEDLRQQGYRVSKEKVVLDYEHCAACLKELGKFHALSYLQKSTDAAKLIKVAHEIKDKWTEDSLKFCENMIQSCAKRGIQPLIDQGESVELLQSLLHEYEDVPTFFKKLVAPREPEAVLCHGDFNRNNLLFQYDVNGRVTGVKLIDLQMPRYSSPVIDLSFLICMNMTHDLRTEHLNELLDVYKNSLMSTVVDNSLVPDMDFSRSSIFGYIISSFFLPVMMAEKLSIEEVLRQGPDQGVNFASKRGGQKETDALTDIVKDFLKFGYIRKSYD